MLYSIAKKFKVKEAIIRKSPAHLTLKYSFITNNKNINELERVIEKFCMKQKKTKLKIEGFGFFGTDVIFLKPIVSDDMRKVHLKFVNELKKLSWMSWKEHDGKDMHFHSTLAMSDFDKKKFEKIMQYLSRFKPKYNLLFDNISIMKMEKGIWKVHKTFGIK